jgi:hypothetical protein
MFFLASEVRSQMNPEDCKQALLAGIEKIDPILNPLGYAFEISGFGVSSGGPFASGFYSKGEKIIGLIYRAGPGLGAVGYEYRQLGILHNDLMLYLNKSVESKLRYSVRKFASVSREGGDPFEALAYDTQSFALEFLGSDDSNFEGVRQQISKTKNVEAIRKRHSRTLRRAVLLGIFYGTLLGVVVGGSITQSRLWGILIGIGIGSVIVILALRNENAN